MQRFLDILEVLRALHIDHKHLFILYCLWAYKEAGVLSLYHFYHFYFTISYVFLSILLYVLVFFSPCFQHFQLCICKQGAIRLYKCIEYAIQKHGHFI